MELSDIEYNKAKHFFLKRNILPEEIEGFYFMKHHYRTRQYSPGTKMGASILTLLLKKGIKVLRLKKDQTAILKFLLSKEIPFSNYVPQKQTSDRIPQKTYKSIANMAFWFCATAMITLLTSTIIYTSFDYNTIYQQEWIRDTKFYILIPLCLSVTLLSWYLLLFRCNYIKTTSKALTIHGIICKTTLPYSHIRKVNFSRHFSRQPSPVLELIDDNFRYRKYILQGVSFKAVDEITQTLQSVGIDATNSNNQRD